MCVCVCVFDKVFSHTIFFNLHKQKLETKKGVQMATRGSHCSLECSRRVWHTRTHTHTLQVFHSASPALEMNPSVVHIIPSTPQPTLPFFPFPWASTFNFKLEYVPRQVQTGLLTGEKPPSTLQMLHVSVWPQSVTIEGLANMDPFFFFIIFLHGLLCYYGDKNAKAGIINSDIGGSLSLLESVLWHSANTGLNCI